MAAPTARLKARNISDRTNETTGLMQNGKSNLELRLEAALFGNENEFLSSLGTVPIPDEGALLRIEQEEDEISEIGSLKDDYTTVADEELFFLDDGRQHVADTLTQDSQDVLKDDEPQRPPLWVDSDDERLVISLASSNRLRKLRDTANDDLVSGKEYTQRLRRQYESLHPVPGWVRYAYKRRKLSGNEPASDDDESDMSVDDDITLTSTQPLSELIRTGNGFSRSIGADGHSPKSRRLRAEVVDIQRLKDICSGGPSSIDTMEFHGQYPLLLSGGPSCTINVYHVAPNAPNGSPLLTSLHLRGTPLHTARFCSSADHGTNHDDSINDTQIFLSSRRRYFHTWSLLSGGIKKVSRPIYGTGRHDQKTMESFTISPCGRFMGIVGSGKKGGGTINVLSTSTMQWVCSCRIDSQGGIADFHWWRSGDGFAAIGKNGEVSEYSIDREQVVYRWRDDGAVGTTVIALGGPTPFDGLGGDRWVAVGSSSGVVNVYDRQEWTPQLNSQVASAHTPLPRRAFDQLTTPISHLQFSHDGQMLVMGSRWKKNALRIIHLPTCTVYKNWPTDRTPLGRVSSIALSKDGSNLAVANEQGKIRLFEIRE